MLKEYTIDPHIETKYLFTLIDIIIIFILFLIPHFIELSVNQKGILSMLVVLLLLYRTLPEIMVITK